MQVLSIVSEIDEFQKLTGTFISTVEKLSKEVEKEKMKAIGLHNVLQNMEKEKQSSQLNLQVFIARNLYILNEAFKYCF